MLLALLLPRSGLCYVFILWCRARVHMGQIVSMKRDADTRVLKVLVDWPEGDELTSTSRGERMTSTVDVHLYLQGVTSMVSLRGSVALKSTASGALAGLKRVVAVSLVLLSPRTQFLGRKRQKGRRSWM